MANREVISPKFEPATQVDIPFLKRLYGNNWQEAARHHGLIPQNSPAVEIQKDTYESEPRDTVD